MSSREDSVELTHRKRRASEAKGDVKYSDEVVVLIASEMEVCHPYVSAQ